jgi:alginate O-acetyltransferase complex protein AlgI
MSYPIDIYRGEADYQKNIIDFGAFVTMFGQLVAGPIVRYQDIADQLNHRRENWDQFGEGVLRFVLGLGKKLLMANTIGLLWERIAGTQISSLTVLNVWLGLLAFGLQIYFDFSAYSDMAIGLAKMFGFEFLENFNYPYISRSISEFWRRWHMSLGTFFRDYVYIPLGGSRKGRLRTYFNIFIVWFLTGFWHGASWNFILWGLYFGFLIMIEKAFLLKWLQGLPTWVQHCYSLFFLLIGWGLFAFEDFGKLCQYFSVLFGLARQPFFQVTDFYYLLNFGPLLMVLLIGSTPAPKNLIQKALQRPWSRYLLTSAFCFCLLFLATAYLVDSSYNPFLYFRF